MSTTLTIIPVAITPYYRYVMLKETDDGHESLMTTTIEDNQDPIETAITHAIKETGFQDFLEEAHNTHVTKAQKNRFFNLLECNIRDYNNADDSIDVFTTLTTHPEKQGRKDITILEITQRLRGQSKIEYNFFITLLDKYDVSEGFGI